jgi:hypothetical protein
MATYMMLIYAPTEPVPADDPGQQPQRWADYTQSLVEAGVHRGDHRLHDPGTATTVRVRDGQTLVTDGPFAETREFLAGYYLLECADLDDALKHASRVPHLSYGSVEVRPVFEMGPGGSGPAE